MPALLLAALLGALLGSGAATAAARTTNRVSVGSTGVQGDKDSYGASISADGRFVAFSSVASNLVLGDTNGLEDVFVRDRKLHSIARVSVGTAGAQGNGFSDGASISADGRFVTFYSEATNLVAGDTNGYRDVFVRDRKLHKTARVSVGTAGAQGDGGSEIESISADGRFVAFTSDATNLVPGDTNGYGDVFVRDRKLHKTARVSVGTAGAQGNGFSDSAYASISADGRFVAFESVATNLVAGDTNAMEDVFVRDRNLHRTVRVSISGAGAQGNGGSYAPSVSAGGRFVAFESVATNLVAGDTNAMQDVFVRDRNLHRTVRVSISGAGAQANGGSYAPSVSADGRFVAFDSVATNLVTSDTNGSSDVFLRDREFHRTVRVSINTAGSQGNANSYDPWVSTDGRVVAFDSGATNLVTSDTNGSYDVFVRGPFG